MIRCLVKTYGLLGAIVVIVISGCAGIPVRGNIGGQWLDARVDSEIARYYLADYLTGRRGQQKLDDRIDALYNGTATNLPDRQMLKTVRDEFSADFAALYFADRIDGRELNREFRSELSRAKQSVSDRLRTGKLDLARELNRYEFLFVPGYLYQRHKMTGADLAAPRAALKRAGIDSRFVATVEDGPIEANAELVATAIRSSAPTGKKLIVVSVSKSGAEVALALTRLGARDAEHVAAWLNIAGTVQGTPLADDELLHIEELVGRIDVAGVESLTAALSRSRFAQFAVPAHILIVNYLGIPVSGSVSMLARSGFRQLRAHGPNDGVALLSDLVMPGSATLFELGRDHFLIDEELDTTTVALALSLARWVESDGARRVRASAGG